MKISCWSVTPPFQPDTAWHILPAALQPMVMPQILPGLHTKAEYDIKGSGLSVSVGL